DTVIKRPASALVPLLATQGILVAAAPSASLIGAAVRLRVGTAQRVRFAWVKPVGSDLATLGEWVEQGLLRPRVDSRFGLDEVARAQARSAEGHAAGKIVIQVAPTS
ncbi:MAG: zinc-binding dehydrogenase, partial [Pseudomonadota bacterium]